MIANEPMKFKVKDSDTVYTISVGPFNQYEITWTNSSGEFRDDLKDKSWVDQQFEKGEWYYIDKIKPVRLEGVVHNVEIKGTLEAEHTGGSVNYYKVHVANPTTLDKPYDAEANDIIESLGLTFAEGNLFKAIWRMAADRNGKKKKGNNSVYDAEKLVFFAERVLVQEKAKNGTE